MFNETMPDEETKRRKYQDFLVDQFRKNRAAASNPDGLFFYGFSNDHLDEMAADIKLILNRMARPFVFVDCAGKRLRQIVLEALGKTEGSVSLQAAWDEWEDTLQGGALTFVLLRPSAMKDTNRGATVRSFLKITDDAHFKDVRTMSEVVIVDFASFLERNLGEIRPYVKIMPYVDLADSWLDSLGSPSLTTVK